MNYQPHVKYPPVPSSGDFSLRIEKLYSHLNGHEWLLVHQPKIWKEIEEAVGNVDASKYKTKISAEKGMKGKRLFSPIELNKRFSTEFRKMVTESTTNGEFSQIQHR